MVDTFDSKSKAVRCEGSSPSSGTNMKKVVVQVSKKYAGYGVFANEDFKKGDVVNNYTPVEISSDTFNNLSQEEIHYVCILAQKYYILDSVTKYINHSCNANTYSPHLGLDIASRNIKKQEEITANYLREDSLGFKCICRSKKCKVFVCNK
jgi:SET domain-containing protein